MRIAICQVRPAEIPEEAKSFFGKPFTEVLGALNFPKFLEWLRKPKIRKCDLIVFPELFPYSWSSLEKNSYITMFAREWCKKTGKYILVGEIFFDKDKKPRNSSTLIKPW